LKEVIVLLSGGIDSTVLLAELLRERIGCKCLFVDYGQRAGAEEYAASKRISHSMNVELIRVVLGSFSGRFRNILTQDNPSLSSVFPARNMLLLTLAAQIGFEEHARAVAIGVIMTTKYPDCTKEFLESAERSITLALGEKMAVLSPFSQLTKGQVVEIGRTLDVPFELTYSCFRGGRKHCGKCEACKERREALEEAQ
jgi:7-cyano-7-deazaguanine synthase